jgi:aspartate/methionine/tyrosine aminotransferase
MRAVDGVLAALADRPSRGHPWLVGDPCVPPPDELRQSLVEAVRSPRFPYPPPAGSAKLRGLLAAHHIGEGTPTSAEQTVVTAGAKSGLMAVLAAVLEPGDEIICPRPCYPAYPAMARRLGANPVAVDEIGRSFSGWTAAVEERLSARTRAVVLSSPSNPTGASLSPDDGRALFELCRDHALRLICDEAYIAFHWKSKLEAGPVSFDSDRRTVVQLRSASKTWAVCGWRVGWVVADAELARRVAERHVSLVGPASSIAQAGLEAFPSIDPEYLPRARAEVLRRLEECCRVITPFDRGLTVPNGGFYLWIDARPFLHDTGLTTTEWCVRLARQTGVGLWPGEDFARSGWVRLAVTAPEASRWRESLDALEQALGRAASGPLDPL